MIATIVFVLTIVLSAAAIANSIIAIYYIRRANALQRGRHVETPPEFLERYMRVLDRVFNPLDKGSN